jgi:hypothetical protein
MCEQCRYSQIETVNAIVAKARPDQLLRLLRDIRQGDQNAGGKAA